MKNIYFFVLLFLVGCKSLDLTLTLPEHFKQIKDTPISITTKDEVDVRMFNTSTNSIHKLLMMEMPISTYSFTADSIIVSTNNFSSGIPFSKITKIDCRGIYDNELGFVSENELIKYMGEHSVFTSVILGIVAGVASSVAIQQLINSNSYEIGEIILFPFIIGGSFLVDYLIITGEINTAIDKIKKERLNK